MIWLLTGLLFVCGLLWFMVKYQSHKIEDLKDENKSLEKEIEIQKNQEEFKAKVLAREQEEILEALKNGKNKTKFDRLNDL